MRIPVELTRVYMPKIYDCQELSKVDINYTCIYANITRLYTQLLTIMDPRIDIQFINIRKLTYKMKFDLLDEYFSTHNCDFQIRSSNLNANDIPFVFGEPIKYYIYQEHRLVDITTPNGLRGGRFNDETSIDLFRVLEGCDRQYYGVS